MFVVAGGVTGVIPLTGKALPFLAQGGSSVVANWLLVALLLKVSDTAPRPAPIPPTAMSAAETQAVRTLRPQPVQEDPRLTAGAGIFLLMHARPVP